MFAILEGSALCLQLWNPVLSIIAAVHISAAVQNSCPFKRVGFL